MTSTVAESGGDEWVDVTGVMFKTLYSGNELSWQLFSQFSQGATADRQWNMFVPPVPMVRYEVSDMVTNAFVDYFVLRIRGSDVMIHADAFRNRGCGRFVIKHICDFDRTLRQLLRLSVEVITDARYESDLTEQYPRLSFVRTVVSLHLGRFREALTQVPVHSTRNLTLFRKLYDMRFALLPPRGLPSSYTDSTYLHVDDALMPQPPTWKLPLMSHQKQSVRWMQLVEQRTQEAMNFVTCRMYTSIAQSGYAMMLDRCIIVPDMPALLHDRRRHCFYRGGVLADRTGSGKTAVALALLVSSEKRVASQEHVMQSGLVSADMIMSRIPVKATLIVVPLNLCKQWQREMDKFVDKRRINMLYLFSKHHYNALTVQTIMACDVLLVSASFLTGKSYGRELRVPAYFDMLSVAERARTGVLSGAEPVRLSDFLWRRIMYDEAHERVLPDTITNQLIAEMYWGLTGTPPLDTMHTELRHVLHMSPTHHEFWPIMYPDLVSATVRTTQTSMQLPPPTVHEHFVDMSARETQLTQAYSMHGVDAVIQISTCFNVVTLFTEEAGGAAAAGGAHGGSHAEDHEFTLMTFTEVARTMVQRFQVLLANQQTRVSELQRRVDQDRQLLALLCSRSGENPEELIAAGVARDESPVSTSASTASGPITPSASTTANPLGASVAVRSLVRQVCQNVRLIDSSGERMAVVQRQLAFCQSQLGEQERGVCPICMESEANVITPCAHWFCGQCLRTHLNSAMPGRATTCPICKTALSGEHVMQIQETPRASNDVAGGATNRAVGDVPMPMVSPASSLVDRCGSKLVHVIELLCDIKSRGERAIMFVQWTSLMRVVKATLHEAGVLAAQIYGNSNTRDLAIKKMQSGEVDVLLLSLETSSSGLNLVEANHVIFAHALTHDNVQVKRALAEQAVARVQRLGQTRPVHVHWFLTRGTEEALYRA